MNTVLVHFWLLQLIYSDEELLNYWQEQLQETLSQCNNNTKSLILDVTPECIAMETQVVNLQNFINQVKIVNPQLRIFLIFNKAMVEETDLSFDNVDDIICIDTYLLYVYNKMLTGSDTNKHWNSDNDKILFLNRRPFAITRVGLLRRLIDLGMENDLKWTLTDLTNSQNAFAMTSDSVVDECLKFLPKMTKQQAKDFIEKNSNIIGAKYDSPADFRLLLDNEKMYSSVLGEIVSETQYLIPKPIYLTEKTFRPIANHIPFIHVGQPDAEKYLKNMGFCTFDINNTSSMLDQQIEKLLENGLDPDIFFQISFHVNRFPKFYKDYRDNSWPLEIEYTDIKTLPINIQAEIIENFFSPVEIQQMLRLHMITINAVSFKETLLKNKQKVKMIIEHNFKKLCELGDYNISNVNQFLTKNNIELDFPNFFELLFTTPSENVIKTRPKL